MILVAPAQLPSAALAEAIGGGDVAAVVLPAASAETDELVRVAQQAGVAALLGYDFESGAALPWPVQHGADGIHASGGFDECYRAVDTRPEGATIGALARDRHEAMTLGDTGADYIWFGDDARLDEDALALASWWQALFEVPAVIAGPCEWSAIDRLIATKSEFIAVNVFQGSVGPGEQVAYINARLQNGVAAS
ncbi:thiamine phosphate synthase [Acuticoccus mangrovi]|uniref:Thiamine phosphate synthase n=1 Tax=Acuticoccus mangrovi TaxID=2796142 RepID=A0A934IIM2_9HYPH|nr:thiamine phosphate synthase [Acuticoccus mangrovi]MBJ3777168.1 thiamine phosphate synthase [Acuticoccus mangrovi]